MKNVRKGKKILIITLIAIAIIVIATVIIVNIVKNNKETPTTPTTQQQVIPLPETTYSDMEVKNISMQYLADQDKTLVEMSIYNTTDKTFENEKLDAIFIDANENVLAQMETLIANELKPGEQYDINVVQKGNLTATTRIKLQEK